MSQFLYSLKQKGRVIILLSFFLIIEILINKNQTENVRDLNTSINEMYSDRLLAQDIIFKIAERINQQRIIMLTEVDQMIVIKHIEANTKRVDSLLIAYGKTKLTNDETLIFDNLKQHVSMLHSFILKSDVGNSSEKNFKTEYIKQLDSITDIFNSLSEVQLSRSNELREKSIKTLSSSGAIGQLSHIISIVIAFCILIIVFVSKSIIPEPPLP
ncbi:MAG: MCP four helix bundle domain-containing protein [Bacteroidia bacterium]|nr:MCP four helix bundle domain-containing protein [Bacteroidia bacterium]